MPWDKPQEAGKVASLAVATREMIMATTGDSRSQKQIIIRRRAQDEAKMAAVALIAVAAAEAVETNGIDAKRCHPLGKIQWDRRGPAMTTATSSAKLCRQCSRH